MESAIKSTTISCTKCNKGTLNRVRRPLLVKLALFWLPLKKFKCNYCDKKTYIIDSFRTGFKRNKLQMR